MDLYGAGIANATGNLNIPRPGPDWPRVRRFRTGARDQAVSRVRRVYVPLWQRVKVKEAEKELAMQPSRWVTTFSLSSAAKLAPCLAGATATWSLWDGYLDEPSGIRLKKFLAKRDISLEVHHTSGHASVIDLQRLAAAIAPKKVVPIHSFGGHRFGEYFSGVESREDGAWWDV